MRRSSNFLIAFAAAAITFGTLNLVIGPKHVEWRSHYDRHHRWHNDAHNPSQREDHRRQDNENKTGDRDNDSEKDF